MKIENKTHWQTAQIASLVRETIKRLPLDVPREWIKRLRVEVVYNRQVRGDTSGRGWYNCPHIKLMLPSQEVDRIDLAHTIAHELAHTRNVRHKDMRGVPWYRRVGDWRERYAWAEQMPLDKRGKKSNIANLQERRAMNASAKVREWESKLKLAQTKLKGWRAKVRYYDRALAAKAARD